MFNELSNNVSNFSKYSTSNYNNQVNFLPVKNEYKIHQVDSRFDENKQTLLSGYNDNFISNNETHQIYKKLDEDLDNIIINDSDEENVNKEIFDNNNKTLTKFNDDDNLIYTKDDFKKELLGFQYPNPKKLNENSKLEKLGFIVSIVENMLIIEKSKDLENIINLDTIIYNNKGNPIGFIFDIIGNIDSPNFILIPYNYKNYERDSNNINDIISTEENLKLNDEVFYDKMFTKTIDKSKLLIVKGCDASNELDQEIDNLNQDFSDDDKEKDFKKQKVNSLSNKCNNIDKANLNKSFRTNYIDPFTLINLEIEKFKK